MAHPEWTYTLTIACSDTSVKELLKAELLACGESAFVEGAVDGLDEEYAYAAPERSGYDEHGGDAAPIQVYKYQFEIIEGLRSKLSSIFGDKIVTKIEKMPTHVWMEGWKESFRPVLTERFAVVPPWEAAPTGRISLVLDPGMAFGTGQHATTALCLRWLEAQPVDQRLLDVGTGTGILAMAACKLGWPEVIATDIDADACAAAQANAQSNGVSYRVLQQSLPAAGGGFDLVVANILATVLRPMFAALVAQVRPGGQLTLCGLLAEEGAEFCGYAQQAELEVVAQQELEGWCLLALRRGAGDA